jgi:hypothetical protein
MHRFHLGQEVRLVRSASANAAEAFLDLVTSVDSRRANEIWEVTRLLPPDGCGSQYHIKATEDGSERLVRESQLQSAHPERNDPPSDRD